jgi:hypothetical protein
VVANRISYGFRFHSTMYGSNNVSMKLARIASGYQAAINGVTDTSLALRKGDPIRALSTGYFELADGNEGAGGGENIDGIIAGIEQYYDGEKLVRAGTRVPYGTTYTGRERETRVWYYPAAGNLFEIDCDDASTAATYAAYLALRGELCDHRLSATTATADGKAKPLLDISTHVAPASSAQWKIEDISKTMNNVDFAGLYVKLIVSVYEGALGV